MSMTADPLLEKFRREKMGNKVAAASVLGLIIAALLLVVIGAISYLMPDVVTVVHNPAQPAYDTYEHSRDIGVFILAAGAAFGFLCVAAISAYVYFFERR